MANWQSSHQEKIIPPAAEEIIPPTVEEIMEEVKEKVPLPSVEEKTPEVERDKPPSQENGPVPQENKPNTMENNTVPQEAEADDDTGNVYAKYYYNGKRLGDWTDRFDHPINNWGTNSEIPPGLWKKWGGHISC